MREELELGVDVPSCEGGVEVVVELFRVDGEGRDVRGTNECVKVVEVDNRSVATSLICPDCGRH